MKMSGRLAQVLPILGWARSYDRGVFGRDLLAALIVSIMLVPQSLAYAMLAGMPPEAGLYASILPLLAYAFFGTSSTLAVGPVAVVSLMTASAVGQVVASLGVSYVEAAAALALISGGVLLLMGILRLGFLADFLSHPVVTGFITGSALLIALGQIKVILGVPASGGTAWQIVGSLAGLIGASHIPTLSIGLAAILMLLLARRYLKSLLLRLGLGQPIAAAAARTAPVLAVVVSIAAVQVLGLRDIALVGSLPSGLPALGIPTLSPQLLQALALPAFLISIVGFVESIAVARTLGKPRRERIEPDRELVGLGAANIAAGLSSGFPVTGGFARSAVNSDAGAATPAAGIITALLIAAAAVYLTPLLSDLPQATLAATIIVAVMSLIDIRAFLRVYRYSRGDFAAMAATALVTLFVSVELGMVAGVTLSLLIHLNHTRRPHIAVVGRVPGTEHYRNIHRHTVETLPHVLCLRVDESLYFANAHFLEDCLGQLVADDHALRHVVLMCSAVNSIDTSALASLESIDADLAAKGIVLHLSEVKGPVMDRLAHSGFLAALRGRIFLSQNAAFLALTETPA